MSRLKIIISIAVIIFLAMFACIVSAAPMPLSVDIMVSPGAVYHVTVKNVDTSFIIEKDTNADGMVSIDWTNYDKTYGVGPGNLFEITVLDKVYNAEAVADGVTMRIVLEGCPSIICPEKICPICKDIDLYEAIMYLVAIVLAMGGGIKIYNGYFKHRHRGIRGYHDANTSHRKLIYRHARFRDNPIQFFIDVSKINKDGSL